MTRNIHYGHRVDISRATARLLLDGEPLPRPGYMKPAPSGPFVCCAKYPPPGEPHEYYVMADTHAERVVGLLDIYGMEEGEFIRRLKEAAKEQRQRDAYPKEPDYVD